MSTEIYGDCRDLLARLPHKSDIYGADKWITDPNHYPLYQRLFQALGVQHLHEIGTMLGYSLVAALHSTNLHKISWVDNEFSVPGSNLKAEANLRWASEQLGVASPEIRHSKRHDLRNLSRPDVVHIDGMHDERAVYADLREALRLKPKYILGHDILQPKSQWFGVRQAVDRFCKEQHLTYLIVDLTYGCFVISLPACGGPSLSILMHDLVTEEMPLAKSANWCRMEELRRIASPPKGVESDKCVCVLACNDNGQKLWDISRQGVYDYANKIGADLVVVEDCQYPEFVLADKLRVKTLFDRYERVLYLDADVLITNKCPSLFDVVPEGSMAMRSDLGGLILRDGRLVDWFTRDMRSYLESQGIDASQPVSTYYNTGLVVMSRRHADSLTPPRLPFPTMWCAEQNCTNDNISKLGIPVREFNPSEVWEYFLENDAPSRCGRPMPEAIQHDLMSNAWALHFAGMGHTPAGAKKRLEMMRYWAGRNA